MSGQDQIDKEDAKSSGMISDEPAELVKGLVKQGAYDIAKQFIDFLATKDKGTKKEQKATGKGQTEN